jgi:Co/Zn/Cd efflux system component
MPDGLAEPGVQALYPGPWRSARELCNRGQVNQGTTFSGIVDQVQRERLRGAIAEIFRPHSHDTADNMDTALEASEGGLRAVKISFAALMVTALIQVLTIWATRSVALLADTIDNFSDALTATPLFIAFRLSRRPPTRRYTYGYRRAEDLARIFVIAMITLSAVIAAYEAIDRLLHPRPLTNIGWLFAAGLIGFAGNELVAQCASGWAAGSARPR